MGLKVREIHVLSCDMYFCENTSGAEIVGDESVPAGYRLPHGWSILQWYGNESAKLGELYVCPGCNSTVRHFVDTGGKP